MTLSDTASAKPGEFEAGGSSPPFPIPPRLADELAEIIAEALVADYSGKVTKPYRSHRIAHPDSMSRGRRCRL
jgi:hypothetical protein